MDADVDPFSGFVAGEAVASADPCDLRKLWDFYRGLPDKTRAVGAEFVKQICSPGADARVVGYRVAMLQLVAGTLGNPRPEVKLDDAVFSVPATFPMQ